MQTAREYFEAGRLQEAIQAMNAEVKSHPTDGNRRGFLAELLCLAGNLERADTQFDAMMQQEPKLAVGISLIRQLIRGEQARRQFFAEGRAPELVGTPPEYLKRAIEASILYRGGDKAGAGRILNEVEEMRPRVAGTSDGRPFDDFRDLDDLTACFFEVITSTGKYFAIPVEQVEFVEFRQPERPRDLIWRRALMTVRDGPDGEVFLPGIYAPLAAEIDDGAKLGRSTDWIGGGDEPVRGVGQRTFLVGDESVPIMQLGRIEFARPA
jgi:type VI secretion system protein ImpE